MQLTKYTDYGLRILMYVACKPDPEDLTRIADICDVFDLSANHVAKLVHQMGKQGYLKTVRGKSGGFKLAMEPENVNVGDVIRGLEKNITPIDCHQSICRLMPVCKLNNILFESMSAFFAVLDKYTLADLVKNRDEFTKIINLN